MIKCAHCKQLKGPEFFNKNSKKPNGKNSYCKTCQSLKNKNWIAANLEKRKQYEANYKKQNKELTRLQKQKWDALNTERRKNYREVNKSRYAFLATQRYVREKQAQPLWLTDQQLNSILELYWLTEDLRRISGERYHVDHIVPLQGETACGLHVPWNLQILPADINIRKSNVLLGDLYNYSKP